MTSELETLIAEQYGDRCPEYDEDCPCCQIWAEYDTRAVPDVPELVRYRLHWSDFDTAYMEIDSMEGEYVLHSQAAEIIAAKDKLYAELEAEFRIAAELGSQISRKLAIRATAAEAELAQYKDQLPIGYITPKAQLSLLQEFSASDSISPVKMGECRVAIYDRPAPAADLKAKCDLYEKTLRGIAELNATDMSYCDQIFAVTSSRAALKVEAGA